MLTSNIQIGFVTSQRFEVDNFAQGTRKLWLQVILIDYWRAFNRSLIRSVFEKRRLIERAPGGVRFQGVASSNPLALGECKKNLNEVPNRRRTLH